MTLQWSYAIAAFWLGAATTVAQQGAATAEPTATHVASYSLAEVGLILSKAYLQHGGLDLVGSSVYGVDVYTVEYSTTELPGTPYAGNPTQMTGVIMVPNRKELDLPVAAHIHETTTLGTSVPSMAFANCGSDDTGDSRRERRESLARERHERVFEEMMGSATSTFGSICLPDTYICPIAMWGGIATASMGFVSVLPDGIGYGGSMGSPTHYLIADGYAASTFNLVAAASLLVPALRPGSSIGSSIVVTGYSEGGYGAIAVHRASVDPRWAAAGVSVKASFAGGGPYDLADSEVEHALNYPDTVEKPSYVLYVAYSYWVALGIDTIFDASFSGSVESWFDGTKASDDIDADIAATTGNNFLSVFNTTMLDLIRESRSNDFSDVLDINSLVTGWTPQAGSTIHLCHGEADSTVLVGNTHSLAGAMSDANVDISVTTLSSSECASHVECAPVCLKHSLLGIWEEHGKWNGALGLGESTATVIGAVLGIGIILAAIGYALYKSRSRNSYDMIA